MKRFLFGMILTAAIITVGFREGEAVDKQEIAPIEGKIAFVTDHSEKTRDIAILEKGQIKFIDEISGKPRWSKDGKKLLYVNMDKIGKLVVVDYQSGGKRYFQPYPGQEPVLFNDETTFEVRDAYLDPKNPKNNTQGVYLFNLQTMEAKKLYESEPGRLIFSIDFAPTGNKMLIADGRLFVGAFEKNQLSGVKQIGYAKWARFSPDGKKIVLSNSYDQDGKKIGDYDQIFILDLETKKTTQLTNNQWNNREPCWSPNGKKICFASAREGHPIVGAALYAINMDGTGEQRISPKGEYSDYKKYPGSGYWRPYTDTEPDWAP